MQEEIDQKTIAIAIKGAKLTGTVLQAALRKFLQMYHKQQNTPHKGRQTMRQLSKHGASLSNIEITDDNIKAFDPIAKKNALDYTVKKIENTKPPTYLVFFKGKDVDVMTEAFREFTALRLKRERKPSVRKALSAAKSKAAAKNVARVKVKNKDKGLDL